MIKREFKVNLKIFKESKKEIIFINSLKPNELIPILNKYNIEHLLIEEVSLEDLFINYYK